MPQYYLIYEDPPSAGSERRYPNWTPSLYRGHPSWSLAVYEVVGETKQRFIVRHAGGDKRHLSRDGQGREYVEKFQQRFARHTTDLGKALAYRERALAAWAAECAARDRVTAPLFAEIERLQALILEADAVRDAASERIREEARDWRPQAAAVA